MTSATQSLAGTSPAPGTASMPASEVAGRDRSTEHRRILGSLKHGSAAYRGGRQWVLPHFDVDYDSMEWLLDARLVKCIGPGRYALSQKGVRYVQREGIA